MQISRRESLSRYNIGFHKGIYNEDEVFTMNQLVHAQRAAHVRKAYYNRRVRPESISTSKRKFLHSYSCYKVYKEIFALACSENAEGDYRKIIADYAANVLKSARSEYQKIDPSDRFTYLALNDAELQDFKATVIDYCDLDTKRVNEAARDQRKALKERDEARKERDAAKRMLNLVLRERNKARRERDKKITNKNF